MTSEQKAKIIWRCRRGMLELDLILNNFIKSQLEKLTEKQLAQFEKLLHEPDPDLYAWLMGYETEKKEYHEIVQLIRYYHPPQSL